MSGYISYAPYGALTAPISSFRTPIRLSRAVDTPFWMRTDRLATKLFSGQLSTSTKKPVNADQPSSLSWGAG